MTGPLSTRARARLLFTASLTAVVLVLSGLTAAGAFAQGIGSGDPFPQLAPSQEPATTTTTTATTASTSSSSGISTSVYIVASALALGLLTVIVGGIFLSARRHAPVAAGAGIDARPDAKRRVSRETRRAKNQSARRQRKRNRPRR